MKIKEEQDLSCSETEVIIKYSKRDRQVHHVIMGIGYILLSGILAYEWGMFISNSLHTVTETGADEWMIIRITLSNILSLLFVLIISQKNIHNK